MWKSSFASKTTSLIPVFPHPPHLGLNFSLTANFNGFNTTLYNRQGCGSSTCEGVAILKELHVRVFHFPKGVKRRDGWRLLAEFYDNDKLARSWDDNPRDESVFISGKLSLTCLVIVQ